MSKIYLPEFNDDSCVLILDGETIRVYETQPYQSESTLINYRDYYINSNYLYSDGVEEFNSESLIPICVDNSLVTDNFYYRNDLDRVLIIFLILTIFTIYLPFKIFVRLGRRFQ